jgi:hypothetical protein
MASPIFNQSILYVNPASNLVDNSIVLATNVSGLGASQCVVGTCPGGIAAGGVLVYEVQCPKPAPLWYISTLNAADSFRISTIENQPISLTTFAAVTGFNGGFFQPNPGQKYVLAYTAGAPIGPGSNTWYLQAVIENTLNQYVEAGSIRFEHYDKVKIKPTVRQIITGNTTSAVPNTYAFDFSDYPIEASQNAIVSFFGVLNAQAIVSYGAYSSMAPSSATTPFTIVGGQMLSINYPGGKGMRYTGTIFMLLANIGMVSLPPTTCVPAAPSVFDETIFTPVTGAPSTDSLVSMLEELRDMVTVQRGMNKHNDSDSDDDDDQSAVILSNVHAMITKLDTKSIWTAIDGLVKMVNGIKSNVNELILTNRTAHERIEDRLASIVAHMSLSEV